MMYIVVMDMWEYMCIVVAYVITQLELVLSHHLVLQSTKKALKKINNEKENEKEKKENEKDNEKETKKKMKTKKKQMITLNSSVDY